MKRLHKLLMLCASQLVLFSQASWAADVYHPLPQVEDEESAYTLTLNTIPKGAGSFNRSSGSTFSAGESVYMYYYANTDFVFEYWQTGDTIISRDRYFYFTMPDHDATLTAVFRYSPASPGNPDMYEKKYTLTLNTVPQGAGSFNRSSGGSFSAGESVYMYYYNNTDYVFDYWQSGDSIITRDRYFNFIMPEHDATLTAVYKYSPGSPANPDTAQFYYTVSLQTQPAGAGSFNWSTFTRRAVGSSGYIYAYNNTDYVFREWQQDGKTVSTDREYSFVMPAQNMNLVAVYDYNPANPGNPGKNYWNEETGEVIVDDFSAGNLSSAVYNTTNGNYNAVQMITVAGPVSQYDWGVVNNYGNCTFLDMSRTYGMTKVPSYNFYGNQVLTTIALPSGIETIDYYAFYDCTALSSISVYAATPPTIGSYAFYGIADIIVYVPVDAVPLYQQAEGWKDFTILPLARDVNTLEVNLPVSTNVALYKDMFIELLNTTSGQKQRYVVTDRLTYTFNSLPKRTAYNVFLKNAKGDVLGEIDDVEVGVDGQGDVSVTFANLMVPRDVTLQVLTPAGVDVTDQTTITWFDQKDTYLTKGNILKGQLEGVNVRFRVQLAQDLAMQYLLPADSIYQVQSVNGIAITLADIPQATIGGQVIDIKAGKPLGGALVTVSQMLNGLYSKSITTKTDRNGLWGLQAYEAKTNITASKDNYVSQTQAFDTLVVDVPDFELRDINGTTIHLNLTYQPTGGELQQYYSDYANVAYTVSIDPSDPLAEQNPQLEYNVQYPQIVFMEQLPAGTLLRVTATSMNQKFIPVTATATVDDLDRASVTLPIVQLGGISASFRQTDNMGVVGILYDGNGRLLKKYNYTSTALNISELQDGQYTLVTMASTQLFSAVGLLSQFTEAGLREGVDYVKNSVTVHSGEMATITNALIPFLDETKLYYTGSNTSVTLNKSQITTGSYLTVTGKIDFKSAYADQVSDVKFIVNLPEQSAFVENSVMRGAQLATYTYSDNQVVVPLDYYGERVRFCFIPTIGGIFTATAKVQFTLGDKVITQPIGNVNYNAKDLSISVPELIARDVLPVSGVANGKSEIEIYDNGKLIGNTIALANGSWLANCNLNNPANLSSHVIYAKVKTPAGVEMQTESKTVIYDRNQIQPNTVNMSFYNGWLRKTVEVTFDFVKGTTDVSDYMFYTGTDITFVLDLSNNSPEVVKGVTLNVFTDRDEVIRLNAAYNARTDRWVAVNRFESNNLPVNLSVSIDAEVAAELDNDVANEDKQEFDDSIEELANTSDEIAETLDQLENEINKADPDYDLVVGYIVHLGDLYEDFTVDYGPHGIDLSNDVIIAQFDDATGEEIVGIVNQMPGIDDNAFNQLMDEYTPNYHQTIPGQTVDNVALPTITIDFDGAPQNPEPGTVYVPDGNWRVDESFGQDSESKVRLVNNSGDRIEYDFGSAIEDHGWTTSGMASYGQLISDISGAYLSTWNLLNGGSFGLDVLDMAYDVEMESMRINQAMLAIARNPDGSVSAEYIRELVERSKLNRPRFEKISKIKSGLRYGSAAVGLLGTGIDGYNAYKSYQKWDVILDKILELCSQDAATPIIEKGEEYKKWVGQRRIWKTVGSLGTTSVGFIASGSAAVTGGTSLLVTLGCFGVDLGLNYWETQYERTDLLHIAEIRRLVLNNPNCIPFPDDDIIPDPPFHPITPIHDPSGYVYEGVASNRLQGVTATAYYKETGEDMYGDPYENIVLWDAEEYAQENPLFTDEYGMYQWDVPQGLWQVKFEKEGYQTTQSEWLPVPPPQLEVNIAMTQLLQPSVTSAKAYSEGVEVAFDKYMDPATLTTDNIIVTRNGQVVEGTIELLDEEVTYEGQTQTYASKVRFTVPENEPLLSTDEVILTVKKAVESYAGMQMQDDYTQAFDVEPKVTSIAVDELINVEYGGERTLTVAALPADASKGKKMFVKSLSSMIATTDNEELTLDENGQAELKVSGDLPGSTVISFTVQDADVTGSMTVNVKEAAKLVTLAPRASRVSGTEVYRGTVIRLTSETEGAEIWYTLDGSCPCESQTALKYNPDEPIIIASDNVTIKALAQGHDLAESEVAEFSYNLKTTDIGYQLYDGWTWISHNLEESVPASTFQTGAERIVSQTQEMINDPSLGFIGTLRELEPATGYKIQRNSNAYLPLSGYEWNAVSQTVPVEAGWNWIGYPLNQIMTVDEALAFFTPGQGDYIVGQDGFSQYADGAWHGTLEGMKPGQGFLYKSAGANEIPFNTTIVSNAVNHVGKRMTLRDSPWAVDKHAYPNITPMTAMLYKDGVPSTDGEYVVAAFNGDECRGIGQWQDGRLLMNLYGEGGEKLSFLAFSKQTESVYVVSDTIEFTPEPVGSWNTPYSLILGGETTGVDELYSDLSITPYVAYDHITVTAGGQDISRLSLTDMSGRTLFSVDLNSKEATIATSQLPEGIYILTVVADGHTYYKKIVKPNK